MITTKVIKEFVGSTGNTLPAGSMVNVINIYYKEAVVEYNGILFKVSKKLLNLNPNLPHERG